MRIKVIHNEEAHEAALVELEKLMDADPQSGSPEFEQMELLALVIKDFEGKQHPIEPLDPIEAIKFRLEQQGLTRKALEVCLGSGAQITEILNRRRPLSLTMVRRLHEHLGIPARTLIAKPIRLRSENRASRWSGFRAGQKAGKI